MLNIRNRFTALAALAMAAGFAAPMNALGRIDRQNGNRVGWRRPRNLIKRMPSDAELAKSAAKMERRRAKVRADVAAGGYGLRPYAGTKGYVPNTPCGVKLIRAEVA